MPGLPSMFDARPAITSALPNDGYIQPNIGQALRVWWAFFWPTTLISGTLSFVLGIALRWGYEEMLERAKLVLFVSRFGDYVLSSIVAIFVMKYILRKTFRQFRIGLLLRGDTGSARVLKPTFKRTLRVWWTYTWRTIFYFAIAWVVVILPLQWFVGIFNPGPTFVGVFFPLLGLIVGGAVGLYVIYSNILGEEMADFCVCLLSREPATGAPSAVGRDPALP